MGLDWSEPFRLRDRLDVSPPDTGLYRIWHDDQITTLVYIGESSRLPRRLYNHEKDFGGGALESFVARPDLDAQHKRLEIETELIGAHYLAHDQPPTGQFGWFPVKSTKILVFIPIYYKCQKGSHLMQ